MEEINKGLLTLACSEWFTKTLNEPLFWEPTDDAASMDPCCPFVWQIKADEFPFQSATNLLYWLGQRNNYS